MTTARTVLTLAALTLREASRRRVLRALALLTLVLKSWIEWCSTARSPAHSARSSRVPAERTVFHARLSVSPAFQDCR